jgi:hypothetical protein
MRVPVLLGKANGKREKQKNEKTKPETAGLQGRQREMR